MKNLIITREQLKMLEGLAYWRADLSYQRERFGDDEPEIMRTRKTIETCLDGLDKIGTPFTAQNIVLSWAEDYRKYLTGYTRDILEARGYEIV